MSEIRINNGSSDDENVNYRIACRIMPSMEIDHGLMRKRRGSIPEKRGNKPRGFEEAYRRVYGDYFHEQKRYEERDFERRFRMPSCVFKHIFKILDGKGIFVQRKDCTGKNVIRPVRDTKALRVLAYAQLADSLDEYVKMEKYSIGLSMREFGKLAVEMFSEEYLGEQSDKGLKRTVKMNSSRGFHGLLRSISSFESEKTVLLLGQGSSEAKKKTHNCVEGNRT